MSAVRKMVNSLFPQVQAKRSQSAGTQSSNYIITPNASMLTYVRERTRASTVPIIDPNGIPIWLIRFIGQGGQARVFLGERQGRCYAVKSFHRQQVIDEGNSRHVRRELGILSHLTEHFPHPFIVELEWAFGYHQSLFLVMDWCPEDLHTRLTSHQLDKTEGKLYAAQLLAAIHHLHTHSIIHRDIKPSNILIDSKGNIKLTDFGFAIQFEPSVPKEMHQIHSRVGTRGYKAPELLSELRLPVSYPSDIYAFGIVLSQIQFATMKKKAIYYTPDKIPQSRFPRPLQVFLTELTDPEPSARPDTATAMNNTWFSSIDWHIILQCGYQNSYRPTCRPLLLNIDLEPIPRPPKHSMRKLDTARSEDLLTGFNYVAPQHSESGLVEKALSSDGLIVLADIPTSLPDQIHPNDLKPSNSKGSSAPVVIPSSSSKTRFSKSPPRKACLALVNDEEEKRLDARPKKPSWSWTPSRGDKRKARSIFHIRAAAVERRSQGDGLHGPTIPALCRAINPKGKSGSSLANSATVGGLS